MTYILKNDDRLENIICSDVVILGGSLISHKAIILKGLCRITKKYIDVRLCA